MLFHLVCFLAFSAVTAAAAFLLTRGKLHRAWNRAGPKPIADALEKRNRILLLVVASILAVLAFFEAAVPRLAYEVQDLQSNALEESLPGWVLFSVGNGSISWMLYLAMLGGIVAGLLGGTIGALRTDPDLRRVGVLDVI